MVSGWPLELLPRVIRGVPCPPEDCFTETLANSQAFWSSLDKTMSNVRHWTKENGERRIFPAFSSRNSVPFRSVGVRLGALLSPSGFINGTGAVKRGLCHDEEAYDCSPLEMFGRSWGPDRIDCTFVKSLSQQLCAPAFQVGGES